MWTLFLMVGLQTQDARAWYDSAQKKMQKGDYAGAIADLSESIDSSSGSYALVLRDPPRGQGGNP